ncbi:hypothetical protein HAX54_017764 [Datura stramonium]|uniref:Uncharacterized protein n=1 Tax=Datura stramonium TaxID=4076 RepID=A0ABS8UL89_DATST|nr:hypothetical protein [Datura stramonium]
MQPLECKKVVSSNLPDDSASSHVSRVEVSTFTAVAVAGNAVIQSKINDKSQDQVQSSVSPEALQEENLDRFTEDGFSGSGGTSNAGGGDSGHTHALTLATNNHQFLHGLFVLNGYPGNSPIIESVNKLHDGNVAPQTEHFIPSGRSLSANQHATAEKGSSSSESLRKLSVSAREVYTKGGGEVSDANLYKPELKAAAHAEKVKSGLVPASLHTDGTGLSLNMENHEPKHWSFFQKIAQGDFARRNVSLMDQDHLSLSSTHANVDDGASMDYGYPPFEGDGAMIAHMDSQLNIEAEFNSRHLKFIAPDTMDLPSEYSAFQATGVHSMQYDVELS